MIDIALSHYERVAGHGYPRGVTSDNISPWSKLIAIVGVCDAITSDRCYHDGMSPTHALTKMYEWRLRDFDPELLEQFIQCIGIYPIGTIVELSSGEAGIVISINSELRLRPKVLLVLDEKRISITRHVSRICPLTILISMKINMALKLCWNPGTYNINVNEHIKDIQQAQRVNMSRKIAEQGRNRVDISGFLSE